MKIGFIGGGNMAEAMIKGIVGNQRPAIGFQGKDLLVSEPVDERREYLKKAFNIETTASNRDVASSCRIIILAVKPQNMGAVLDEIKDIVTGEQTVVSIAAGIKLDHLSSRLKTRKLIRVMPNTPALVQEGMSVMSLCECFLDNDIGVVRDILMSIGKVVTLPEKYMDAVTALSGSGPAFIALFVEAMVEGAVTIGLNENDALALTVQTVAGTSKLLDTGMTPARLREMVTSPGGTTAAGLAVFDEKGLKDIVKAAIRAARNRSEELGRS